MAKEDTEIPKQMPNKRVPPPENYDIRDYTDKVFRMYGGIEEQVTLRCNKKILYNGARKPDQALCKRS